jgi:hypothetical protein
MKNSLVSLLIVLLLTNFAEAQTRFIVRFTDKGNSPFSLSDPSAFLSQRSVERRTRYSIAIDSTDLPVTARYIDSIRLAGDVTILNVSKWLNAVSIQTTDADAIDKINNFPFVKSFADLASKSFPGSNPFNKLMPGYTNPLVMQKQAGINNDVFDYGSSFNQLHIHHGEFLHNIGLRGQNMVIGMLDAGYQNYLTVNSLDSARQNGQILGVYDFVAGDSSVNEDHSHGMQCLSTIAANFPGQFVGTAPKSQFYLFRSEDASSEYPVEEFNWVCAAERVDSVGGDLISSSLGYNSFNAPLESQSHPFPAMDGNTTIAATGADLAAKKGILVVNSAGNEGTNSWGRILTPADGDSVLAVGAVNSQGWAANFTSRGPSADGQIKPDVAAHGVNTTVQLPNNTIGANNGTSFAAPNMAGLASCLWQGFPEYNNMRIIKALRQSGNRSDNPNDSTGYGIPDMRKAFVNLAKEYSTASGTETNTLCRVFVSWQSKDNAGMRYEIERKNPGSSSFFKVGELNTNATGYSSRSYQFKDSLVQVDAGMITYRIRQVVDTSAVNGYGDYIDTFTVNSGIACIHTAINAVIANEKMLTILPNPANSETTLRISTDRPMTELIIRIFDSKGKEVYHKAGSKGSGTATFRIPLQGLSSGKYYLSVYNAQQLFATKELIKL